MSCSGISPATEHMINLSASWEIWWCLNRRNLRLRWFHILTTVTSWIKLIRSHYKENVSRDLTSSAPECCFSISSTRFFSNSFSLSRVWTLCLASSSRFSRNPLSSFCFSFQADSPSNLSFIDRLVCFRASAHESQMEGQCACVSYSMRICNALFWACCRGHISVTSKTKTSWSNPFDLNN